jgi:hypothetical protein
MRKCLFFTIIFVFSICVYAQTPQTPTIPVRTETAAERSNVPPNNNTYKPELQTVYSPNLKTILPDSLKQKLKISEAEESEFAEMLKDKKVRLLKIWNNTCGDKVFDVNNEDCLQKANFQLGSTYSLRLKDYKSFYSHIKIINGEFITPNKDTTVQLLTDLGEISLDNVNKNLKEAKELWKFTDKSDANKLKRKIENGFKINQLAVSNKSKLKLNHTYLLRSIFLEFIPQAIFTVKVDKLYAIQVLKDTDGFVTIAWKEVKM